VEFENKQKQEVSGPADTQCDQGNQQQYGLHQRVSIKVSPGSADIPVKCKSTSSNHCQENQADGSYQII